MDYLEKFKTAKIGGFKKEDVLEYIDQLISENEKKYSDINKQLSKAENDSHEKDEQIKDLQTKLRQCVVQLQKSKNTIKTMDENHQTIIEEKNRLLDETELNNRQISYKIKVLEDKISRFNSIEQEKQAMINKAEKISKDKTNQMILEAKRMVEEEYNQKLDAANRKAAEILNNAEIKAVEIVAKSKKEIMSIIEQAEHQSEEIIHKAHVTAKTIITDAAEQKLKRSTGKFKAQNNSRLISDFENDLENLRQNIQQEVKEVILQLDKASESVETAKKKAEKLPKAAIESPISKETTRYKLAVKRFLKQD